ncbi:MAG: LacI family DNA-binding transcriptional regulator [Lachnospiraceae bacterium]
MEVTIIDIAKKCGVGVSTVSRAINNHPDINPRTKELVMKTIAEYNYVPNNSARNLKRTASKTIAILVKGISNPLFSTLVQMIEKEISRNKYSFFLQHIDERQDEVDVALELIKEKRLKGIVFLGGYFSHSQEKLKQINVPFVLSTAGIQDLEDCGICSYFSVDDKVESYKVTDYLCKQGHRQIAILGPLEYDASIGRMRLEGYQEALQANGIPVDERLIRHMKEDVQSYSMQNGYEVMKALLEEDLPFTAVYAISDMQAIGACKAIFQKGYRIPEDFVVAGFDGLPDTFFYEPSITTMKQPVEAIAEASIRALFHMIKSKESVPGKVFEGQLIARESTALVR